MRELEGYPAHDVHRALELEVPGGIDEEEHTALARRLEVHLHRVGAAPEAREDAAVHLEVARGAASHLLAREKPGIARVVAPGEQVLPHPLRVFAPAESHDQVAARIVDAEFGQL